MELDDSHININYRLPDKSGSYLVYVKFNYVSGYCELVGEYIINQGWSKETLDLIKCLNIGKKITHWKKFNRLYL